jgi:ankyrin repeat protein
MAVVAGIGEVWVNWANEQGLSALHLAVGNKNLELARLCISIGADVNAKDADGWTPLHLGAYKGDLDICEMLVQHSNIAVMAINKDGTLPFHYLVRHIPLDTERRRYTKLLSILLQKGTPINAQTKHGEAPIHRACLEGNYIAVHFLINNGAMLNVQTKNGETPLYYAVKRGHKLLVTLLVENGADSSLGSSTGSAIDLANVSDQREIYFFLLGFCDKTTTHKRKYLVILLALIKYKQDTTSTTEESPNCYNSSSTQIADDKAACIHPQHS